MKSAPQIPDDTPPTLSDHQSPPRTPRWVKIFGIVAVVVLVVLVIGLLTGGHGPGRHIPQSPITQHTTRP